MAERINLKGIEEGRAIFAYNCVKDVYNNSSKKIAKEYKSYAKKVPTMIQNNGLGPALAFVYSKGNGKEKEEEEYKNAYSILYKDIGTRLKSEEVGLLDKDKDLIESILEMDTVSYREVSIEVLSLFSWLRRFVDGVIEGEVNE